jgi:hypothetical protein
MTVKESDTGRIIGLESSFLGHYTIRRSSNIFGSLRFLMNVVILSIYEAIDRNLM